MAAVLMLAIGATAQQQQIEPEFVGEACILNADACVPLDKEIGGFSRGISWSHNSPNALWLEVAGGRANSRVIASANAALKLVVRAADNNSDPLTIISIYTLKSKKAKRSVLLSEDNSGTLMKSRTNNEDLVPFIGKRFGASSYLIEVNIPAAGEYGIVVSNPNSLDGKRVVVSCFGVDTAFQKLGVTMAGFNALENGMSYEDAVTILGRAGEKMSESEIGGVQTVMYQWKADRGSLGANMNAMFQDGKLILKAQAGLK